MDSAEQDIKDPNQNQSQNYYSSCSSNIPLDLEVDILFPGRLKLPRTQTPELDPDFYLSVTKKQQTSTEINYPFDITLDYLAKTVFYKYVKSIDELIHDGPHSTILLVELIKPIDHEDTVIQKCVVKVCKPCYDERFHSKNKHTSKCLSKADRARTEFDILKRMQKVGIRVPTMYTCQKNVIFMSDMKAPKNQLKYFISSKHDVSIVYQQLVEMMTLFYRKAKLVHKYVSKMNIVVDDQFNCWFLDVGSTIDGAQSEALDSLMTDCIKNEQIFRCRGNLGQNALTANDFFAKITSISPFHREQWTS